MTRPAHASTSVSAPDPIGAGPSRPLFLGIDLGTTEVKIGLIDLDGRPVAVARCGYPLDYGVSRGRAEQDPERWWSAVRTAIAEVVAKAAGATGRPTTIAAPAAIAAIGIDGQGPVCVAVDADGRATRPAISWLDSRATREVADLTQRTGLAGWSLANWPLALWIARHDPEAAARTRWYLETWEWLAFRLTGRAAKSVATSGPTPSAGDLAAVGIAERAVPPVVAAGSVLGNLTASAAADLGLVAGTPVVAGLVDAYAGCHGAGLSEPGHAIDTGGASGGFGLYLDRPIDIPGAAAAPAPLAGCWLAGGAMASTGKALDWVADSVLAAAVPLDVLIAEAAATPAGADDLVFLPYLAGERAPIFDPDARGAFAGLSLGHGRGHLVRAVLEAAAFAIRHVAAPLLSAGAVVTEMRVTGGPARSELWNQVKADITGFTVALPAVPETAMLGSAIVAATGIGARPDLPEAIRAMVRIDRRIAPRLEHRKGYDQLFERYVDLHPRLSPTVRRLGAIDRSSRAAVASA